MEYLEGLIRNVAYYKLQVIMHFRLYWSQIIVRYLKYQKVYDCHKIDGNKI